MNYSERIQQMQEQGTLSPTQAARLKEALKIQDTAQRVGAATRKSLPVTWILAGLGVSILAIMVIAGGSDTQPVQNVSEALNQPGGVGLMNKGVTTILSVLLLLVVPLLIFATSYNGIVSKEEEVFAAWAQVESNYQRRADLIPNLVETVSKYIKHERETLSEVTAQRGDASGLDEALEQLVKSQESSAKVMKETAGKLPQEEEYLAKLTAAQNGVGLGMRKVLAVAENYPNLRSSDHMLELQAQLEGTENRINVARMRFNEAAEAFNSAIRKMPASLVASLSNFSRKAYFKSDEGADYVVKVKFE